MSFSVDEERIIRAKMFGDGVATVADLVAIRGATPSATELGYIDGITAGTVAVDKAIVPTTNKHIDTIVITDGGLKLGSGAGTAVLATAAELNILDDCTATYHDLNAQSTIPHAPACTAVKTAGAANIANLAYTIKDPGGTSLTHCAWLMLWLSDSAAGEGVTSHAPDQLAIVSSLGSILTEFVTDSCALVQCKNDGRLSIAITDTHKTLYKVCLQSLNGEQISIDTLVLADYGE